MRTQFHHHIQFAEIVRVVWLFSLSGFHTTHSPNKHLLGGCLPQVQDSPSGTEMFVHNVSPLEFWQANIQGSSNHKNILSLGKLDGRVKHTFSKQSQSVWKPFGAGFTSVTFLTSLQLSFKLKGVDERVN